MRDGESFRPGGGNNKEETGYGDLRSVCVRNTRENRNKEESSRGPKLQVGVTGETVSIKGYEDGRRVGCGSKAEQ